MLIEYSDRRFSTVRGSDSARNGMFLELFEAGSSDVLMEVFHCDADGYFCLTGFGGSIPLDVAEQFIAESRRVLLPLPAN